MRGEDLLGSVRASPMLKAVFSAVSCSALHSFTFTLEFFLNLVAAEKGFMLSPCKLRSLGRPSCACSAIVPLCEVVETAVLCVLRSVFIGFHSFNVWFVYID